MFSFFTLQLENNNDNMDGNKEEEKKKEEAEGHHLMRHRSDSVGQEKRKMRAIWNNDKQLKVNGFFLFRCLWNRQWKRFVLNKNYISFHGRSFLYSRTIILQLRIRHTLKFIQNVYVDINTDKNTRRHTCVYIYIYIYFKKNNKPVTLGL